MGATKSLAKLLCGRKGKKREKKKKSEEKESPPEKTPEESATLALKNEESEEDSTGTNGRPRRQPFEELFPGGDTKGTRVLYVPPRRSKPQVDIVFVHGLKGHPYTTWLDVQSGTYWPAHLLPHHVPDARIMAFGYDADPAKFMSSQNDMADHAHSLLGDLARERRKDPVRNKNSKKNKKITLPLISVWYLLLTSF